MKSENEPMIGDRIASDDPWTEQDSVAYWKAQAEAWQQLAVGGKAFRDDNDALRAENEQLREECRLAAELQIRTGQEADAENERLQAAREQDRELADRLLKFANDEIERLRAALQGILAEADRKTAAFDRAHELLTGH